MSHSQIIIKINNHLLPNVFPFLKGRNYYYILLISGQVSDHPGRLGEMSISPANAPPPTIPYTSPPVTVVLTVILLLFFFIGFFSIYFCRCFMQNVFHTWNTRQNPIRAGPAGPGGDCVHPGLDPLIITSFPTFTYSSVKDYHRDNYGLECAICLCEFKDDNILRLLTKCYHVFHQECIDLWLGSHKTCPCCRCSLDTPINSPEKSPVTNIGPALPENQENNQREESVAIDIKENDVVIEMGTDDHKIREGLTRSKSTGHSIVKNRKESEKDDKFTLRLPQDVQDKLVPRHKWRSCTEFGEYKSKTWSSSGGNFSESDKPNL